MVLSFVALAVGGLVLVQRLVPIERRLAHNDVAGFIYAVLGVAYGVLLGLMVLAVWQDWQAAREAATQEANELAAVFWLAHGLPEPEDATSRGWPAPTRGWRCTRSGRSWNAGSPAPRPTFS